MMAMRSDAAGLWVTPDGNVWLEASECPECCGTGEVDIGIPRPQSPTRDIGEIDVGKGTCENCDGLGAIAK